MANKTRKTVLVLAALLLAFAAAPLWAADKKEDPDVVKKGDNLVEVTASGSGTTKDEAVKDAQRKAIERGAGAYIHSQSETRDYQLIYDTILARAAGYLQEYKVVSASENDGIITVKIKAVVSVKGIEDTWGVVQNLLKAMGRPKIMVFISEKVDDKASDDSTVQTKIEALLLKNGFELVDKKQVKEIDKKDLAAAVTEDKPAKAQAIAKRFGAQIFISGSAEAAFGEATKVWDVKLQNYGAKANVTCFLSDTAKKIGSHNAKEASSDRMKNVAADKALAGLGDQLALQVQMAVLEHWMEAMQGRGDVKLEVSGIAFKQVGKLTEALKGVQGVTDVDEPREFHNNVAEYSLKTALTAKELAKKFADIANLDITDVSQNVVKATWKDGAKEETK